MFLKDFHCIKELDNLKTEEELKLFEDQLSDRFGPIPALVEDLLQSIRLRRKAQEIGFTRLIIKSEKMIGYFTESPEHIYYQSPIFTQVLNYIQTNPKGVKMNQKNEKLRLVFSDVKDIDEALARVSAIMP